MRSWTRWTSVFAGATLLVGCSLGSPLLVPTPVDTASLAPVADRDTAAVGRLLSTTCTGAPLAGTGFVVGPGLVLTAAHVVDGARQVSLRLADAEPVAARVIGIDASRDTALVRADAIGADIPRIALADDATAVGESVVVLGYPLGESDSHLSFARITSVTDSAIVNGFPMQDLVTVDATVPVGMSGGPVLDADGVARGMVVAAIAGRGGRDSVATVTLALPASALAGSLAQWRDDQPVRSGPCAGEVDRGDVADPTLTLTSTDADAPELGHTLWLLGRSINAGQYPGAAGLLTSSLLAGEGGAQAWEQGLGQTRWEGIDLRGATRDGDHATARVLLRTRTDAGCRVQQVEVGFERTGGVWLVDAFASVGGAQRC